MECIWDSIVCTPSATDKIFKMIVGRAACIGEGANQEISLSRIAGYDTMLMHIVLGQVLIAFCAAVSQLTQRLILPLHMIP